MNELHALIELHVLIEQGRAAVLADLEAQEAERLAKEEQEEAENATFWRLVRDRLPVAIHPMIVEDDKTGWRNWYDIEVILTSDNLAPMLAKFTYPAISEDDFKLSCYMVRTASTDGPERPDWKGWTTYERHEVAKALGVASLRAEKLAELQAAWDQEHPTKPEPVEPEDDETSAYWIAMAMDHYDETRIEISTAAALIAIAKLFQDNMELTARQMF